MAALIVRENLDIVGDRALGHYTHEKSSVGCAAALATLECLLEDELIDNSVALGEKGLTRLEDMKLKYPIVSDVRGLGLFFGIELTKNGKPAQKEAEEILYHSLSNGLSYKVGGGCILTLCPPMTITEEELNKAFNIIEAGIKEVY